QRARQARCVMLRLVLLLILIVFIARAFWRVVDGVLEGMRGGRSVAPGTSPSRSVPMVRDPVCGTFVVPERAVSALSDGRQWHFCPTGCRDAFLSRPHPSERAHA